MKPTTTTPATSEPLRDRCGRPITNLRVSVTDRCNLRCRYCMPYDGMDFVPRRELLTFEELVRTIRVATTLGIRKIRITGGEPLLRQDLPLLIRMIREETVVEDIAMTTNGLLLEKHAQALADAGLERINVSCDSLDPERFERMTRFAMLEDVWKGIAAANDAGMSPIRINALLLDGFNGDEAERWLDLVDERPLTVRFMELMPIGEGAHVRKLGAYLNLARLRDELIDRHGLVPASPSVGNGPARYWKRHGATGMIGFITPISDKYCATCTRMRLTSTGDLRPCLAYDVHVSIRDAIREGTDHDIAEGFRRAAAIKAEGHHWDEGQTTRVGMSALGG